jgi:hypothetical protein
LSREPKIKFETFFFLLTFSFKPLAHDLYTMSKREEATKVCVGRGPGREIKNLSLFHYLLGFRLYY